MNIFETYLKEILNLIKTNQKELDLQKTNNFKGVVLEIPPSNISLDLSSNICMVLAKLNRLDPNKLALKVKDLIKKNLSDFKEVEIAKPGFININLSDNALTTIINSIFNEHKRFGSMNTNHSYNIEFVSANPTGPMHVGHSRGAIFGDVLSNLLIFNGNKVTKEYYINPQDRAFSLAGTMHHAKLEQYQDDRHLLEQKLQEFNITGIADLYDKKSKMLLDYKNTGSYKCAQLLGMTYRLVPDPSGAKYKSSGKWGKKGSPKIES